MVGITTALFAEASPIIHQYKLKKETNNGKFLIYSNTKICLIITGIGKLSTAIATTYLLTKFKCCVILNVGICGSKDTFYKVGEFFLINKIKDHLTSKFFYPDNLINFGYKENTLETVDFIAREEHKSIITENLVDMEGFGFFQASSRFVKSHQIILFKIVSDHLKSISFLGKEVITDLIFSHLDKLDLIIHQNWENENLLSIEELNSISRLGEDFFLSETLKNQLKDIFIYYKLNHKDIHQIIERFSEERTPSKKRAKKILEQLKNEFL